MTGFLLWTFSPACAGRAAPTPVEISETAPLDAAPAPGALTCGGDGRATWNPYERTETLSGGNGVFTDHCDARGDLVSYQCEEKDLPCERGRGDDRHPAAPCYRQTGDVTEASVSCDGRCAAGACASRCPTAGDRLTYVSIAADGAAVFASDHDARGLACKLGFDQPSDTYDCARDPRPGDVLVVHGLGLSVTMCTGGVWGAISDPRCTYTGCRYVTLAP